MALNNTKILTNVEYLHEQKPIQQDHNSRN